MQLSQVDLHGQLLYKDQSLTLVCTLISVCLGSNRANPRVLISWSSTVGTSVLYLPARVQLDPWFMRFEFENDVIVK